MLYCTLRLPSKPEVQVGGPCHFGSSIALQSPVLAFVEIALLNEPVKTKNLASQEGRFEPSVRHWPGISVACLGCCLIPRQCKQPRDMLQASILLVKLRWVAWR